MPPLSTRSAMAAKAALPCSGIAAPVSTSTSRSNSLAVTHGQRHRDEAAEAIAQQVGLGRQAELGQFAGDAVGEILQAGAGRSRGAEARQVDEPDPALQREPRRDAVERGAVREQRVQQHEIAGPVALGWPIITMSSAELWVDMAP